jgi:hypothetical protein
VVAINTATSSVFGANTNISYPDYADLRDRNRSFDGLVAASFVRLGYAAAPARSGSGLQSAGIRGR